MTLSRSVSIIATEFLCEKKIGSKNAQRLHSGARIDLRAVRLYMYSGSIHNCPNPYFVHNIMIIIQFVKLMLPHRIIYFKPRNICVPAIPVVCISSPLDSGCRTQGSLVEKRHGDTESLHGVIVHLKDGSLAVGRRHTQ